MAIVQSPFGPTYEADGTVNISLVPLGGFYSDAAPTVLVPFFTDVDTDEDIYPGQTSVVITGGNFLTPRGSGRARLNSQSDGLGIDIEQTDTIWSDTSIQITVIQGELKYGTVYLFVSNSDGEENTVGFTLTLSTSAANSDINFFGPAPDPLTTESFYEECIADLAITPAVGDQLEFSNFTGLTVDSAWVVTISPGATATGFYRVWDTTTETWSALTAYTISDGAVVSPVLSLATITQIDTTRLGLSVTTDTAAGTLYLYVSQSVTPPTDTDLKAGTGADYSGSQIVSTTGAQTDTAVLLVAATTYYLHAIHTNGGVDSTIISSSGVATTVGGQSHMVTIYNPINMNSWYRKIKEPRWDDLRFPSTEINPPGAVSDPDRSSTTGLLLFDASGTETVVVIAQLPHDRAPGSPLGLHVHWAKTTAAAGNVTWQVSVQKWRVGEVWDTAVVSSNSTSVVAFPDADTAHQQLITAIVEVDGTDLTDSDSLYIQLSRVGGDAGDTYGADAELLEFDVHYQRDGLGSIAQWGDGNE